MTEGLERLDKGATDVIERSNEIAKEVDDGILEGQNKMKKWRQDFYKSIDSFCEENRGGVSCEEQRKQMEKEEEEYEKSDEETREFLQRTHEWTEKFNKKFDESWKRISEE